MTTAHELDRAWELRPDRGAFAQLAKVVLDVRLVAGLLALTWAVIDGRPPAIVLGLMLWMIAVLLLLLRWRRYAAPLINHPVLHLTDLAASTALLTGAGLLTPVTFLILTGALFTGLCLGGRGVRVFSVGYLVGWLIAVGTQLPAATSAGLGFLALVVVPTLLVAMLVGGAAFRATVTSASRLAERLHREHELSAVLAERARLARELHDSVTKSLYGMAMLADALPATIRADPDVAAAQAASLADAARVATRESRELLVAMRRTDAGAGLGELVERVGERWRATSGRCLRVEIWPATYAVEAGALYEVGAILAEALENVARHTPTDCSAWLELTATDGWARIRLRDDGPGLDAPPTNSASATGHYGLLGMRERASRIGGRLSIGSAAADTGASGTVVTLEVPLAISSHTTTKG